MSSSPLVAKSEVKKGSSCRTGPMAAVFCPHNGLITGGASTMFNAQTGGLLRSRLFVLNVLFVLISAALVIMGFAVETPMAGLRLLPPLVFAASAWLLARPVDYSLPAMRTFEAVVFGTAVVTVTIERWAAASIANGTGDVAIQLGQMQATATYFFVLLVAYGMFIPNTGRRAALVALGVLVAAAGVLGWQWSTLAGPAPAAGFGQSYGPGYAALLLGTGALLAVAAAQVVHRSREQAMNAAAVGVYKLNERIGEGGMGEVWLAEHELLARQAAIKIIRPEALAREESRELVLQRFEREAKTTAQLRSPHTVELYDFGVTDAGTLYYVMEYLDGVDLEKLVEKYGPVPDERAIHLLRQAAESLAEAHDRGLIHRDIKPSNIYVCTLGRQRDFVKVLDFGLVKGSNGPQSSKLTQEGTTAGTPAYMAPEVALDKGEIDHRADIYALGCVAYWLVTGGLVFDSKTPVEMIVDHARTAPEPPSRRSEVPISPALDKAILACLDKDPNRRPADVNAFLHLLDECENASAWTPDRAAQWWSRHLPRAAAATAN